MDGHNKTIDAKMIAARSKMFQDVNDENTALRAKVLSLRSLVIDLTNQVQALNKDNYEMRVRLADQTLWDVTTETNEARWTCPCGLIYTGHRPDYCNGCGFRED